MKRSLSLFVLLFVVVQSFVWTAAAADKALYEDAIHTARREIWKTLSSGKASSATIAFMDNGKIVYSEGFGMRDRENALPVREEHPVQYWFDQQDFHGRRHSFAGG